MMRISTLLLLTVCAVSAAVAQPYQPTWESIDSRPTPAWFNEAKFGIFIHWGVYAVPSWSPVTTYSEWYWNHMQDKNGPTWKFHVATYGEDFQYQDFAPMFKAELYDPTLWASLFKRSGAKYIVLTSKHHEGFCLWPSPDSWNWNAVDIGPHRDVLGELSEAVKAVGIKMGFYYSLYEWYNPIYHSDVNRYVQEHMLPQMKDLVTKYQPSMIWPDGEWEHPSETWRSTEFLAWLFNESPVKDEIAVNDRWGKECRGKHGGFHTSEYGGFGGESVGPQHPWEECRGMGASFGYNRNETIDNYHSAAELIRLLADTASAGGNLLLDIGPTADGRIPVIMQERLVQMGEWLAVNGDSIYGTAAGPFRNRSWGGCTRKGNTLYFHVFDWPQGTFEIRGLKNAVQKAYLLGAAETPLGVSQDGAIVRVELPVCKPNTIAGVVALEIAGEPDVDESIHQAEDGSVVLPAAMASTKGEGPHYEAAKDCIGYWTNGKATVSWELTIATPGTFQAEIDYACTEASAGGRYAVSVGDQELEDKVASTGGWETFQNKPIGELKIAAPGKYTLTVTPKTKPKEGVMNLRAITLKRIGD